MSAKIAKALHDIMNACGYVQKTGKNAFHGYKYAGEADLLEKLRPAMIEAGLLLIPSVKHVSEIDQHGNVNVVVEYTLVHKDGDVWPEKVIGVGCGNDASPKTGRVGDKGVYKAITGANKYVLFKLFQIETGDDPEVDAEHDKPVDWKQEGRDIAQIVNGITEVDALTEFYKTPRVQAYLKNSPNGDALKATFSERKHVLTRHAEAA